MVQYKNMEKQTDTQYEAVVEEPEQVKKKMGRPRIHPMKPPKESPHCFQMTLKLILGSITACTRKQYSYVLLATQNSRVKAATPYMQELLTVV